MMPIVYRNVDLFSETPTAKRIIPHICNDIGAWGAGFVLAISKHWKLPEERYRMWHSEGSYTTISPYKGHPIISGKTDLTPGEGIPVLPPDELMKPKSMDAPNPKEEKRIPFRLGMVQYVPIPQSGGTIVCNMIAQHGLKSKDNQKAIRYSALVRCLERVEAACHGMKDIEIHAPKFGAGLAGGDWDVIASLINEIWVDNNLKVFIYDFTP